MPTLAELVDGVFRDLADEGKGVFSTLQVEDFVRGGIADLNRVAPLDTIEDVALTVDPDTGAVTAFVYDIGIQLPYRVEVHHTATGWTTTVPNADQEGEGNSSNGYTFRATAAGGRIEFPQWWLGSFDAANYTIRVLGYGARPLPPSVEDPTPSPETGLSETETYSVRSYAKSAGFDLLAHDRSLFAQWQGQTNNTDVSPTQMTQMAAGAKQEWDRQRGLIRVVRKAW